MFIKVLQFNLLYLRHILIFSFLLAIVIIYNTNKDIMFSDEPSIDCGIFPNISEPQNNWNTSQILNFIQSSNKEKYIRNMDTFGAIKVDTVVFVILLDKFSKGFMCVIYSLSQITGIEEALVIFSHSYLDENFNSVIRGIDFCRVLQIYYPYSIQTHLDEFPGYDRKKSANHQSSKNCGEDCNVPWSDKRKSKRDPTVIERKHHWWWTANYVFDYLSSSSTHGGLVIFTEDNFIYMTDFIYMATFMQNIADTLPQCEFLSLGSNTPPMPKAKDIKDLYSVELSTWHPKNHSRLLAFDIAVWNKIFPYYDIFCTIDDASWLQSLYFVSGHRREEKKFKILSTVSPRAFKIDTCRTYFCGSRYNIDKNILDVTKLEKRYANNLFPSHMELFINLEFEVPYADYSESDGEFSDPRDWALCRNITLHK